MTWKRDILHSQKYQDGGWGRRACSTPPVAALAPPPPCYLKYICRVNPPPSQSVNVNVLMLDLENWHFLYFSFHTQNFGKKTCFLRQPRKTSITDCVWVWPKLVCVKFSNFDELRHSFVDLTQFGKCFFCEKRKHCTRVHTTFKSSCE